MSNDSTAIPPNSPDFPAQPKSPEDRLLDLMEKWVTAAASMSETTRSIRKLLDANTDLQTTVKEKVMELETSCANLTTHLTTLRAHCQESQRKAGVMGAMEWMMKSAKEQPLAFAMIFMTMVMFLVMLTVLGYKLNLQSLFGG